MEEWWSKSTPDPAGVEPDHHPKFYWANIDSCEYWLSKSCWPNLQKVARWWLEVQMSSLDTERAMAVGRVIDVPNRRSQTWAAFRRELVFRMHAEDVDELLMGALGHM